MASRNCANKRRRYIPSKSTHRTFDAYIELITSRGTQRCRMLGACLCHYMAISMSHIINTAHFRISNSEIILEFHIQLFELDVSWIKFDLFSYRRSFNFCFFTGAWFFAFKGATFNWYIVLNDLYWTSWSHTRFCSKQNVVIRMKVTYQSMISSSKMVHVSNEQVIFDVV